MKNKGLIAALLMGMGMTVQAQTHEFVIQTKKLGAEIQPTMYGVFFEDINFAADGGLYAELIKNRSFEFPQAFTGWKVFGKVSLMDDGPFNRNPHYVRLAPAGHPHKWKKYQVILKPEETLEKAVLRISLVSPQSVDLEHISLFPVDTWKGYENGLRKDLVQALADLKPGVFRFPGGCIVEGTDLETRYNWKNSVGPVESRPLNESRWQYSFPNRLYPDYYQSYGLGFYEFFVLSEEIGAEPLPVLSCGLACQFQNTDESAHQPVDQLDGYIQDALDLIEFANGGTDTRWGKVRADMGHPEPFHLKYIGIGNEQWGEEYPVRLKPFIEAIRKAYPEIKIIGSSGPDSEGKQFDYLWGQMKHLGVDLVDEHFYRPESFFLSQGARYDTYDRKKGPKVFAGEYACHGVGRKWNHFHASLLEAAFMTGLERNADIVYMATYAPLFAHVEGWQWRPDMIWYDNLRSVRTASYYVQQLYSLNKGTNVLSLTMDGKPVTGADGQDGLFASAVYNKLTDEVIVKVANTSDKTQSIDFILKGMKKGERLSAGRRITLSTPDVYADNTLDNPSLITPREEAIQVSGQSLHVDLGPNAFAVYILKK